MEMPLAAYQEAKIFSDAKLAKLRGLFEKRAPPTGCLIGTNGSFARREGSEESDLDLFAVCKENSSKKALQDYLIEIESDLREIVPIPPAINGAFNDAESFDEVLQNVGGNSDTNKKFTRRVLFLLEGEWLSGESIFTSLRESLINKYIRENISDHQLALFLLNDIIRYYRTICVDFEFKTSEDRKDWGTRNIKLMFSRKLLYFSGVLCIAETFRKTAKEKRKILSDLFSRPVVDRIIHISGDGALRPLALYDEFLFEMSKSEIRQELKSIVEIQRNDSEAFRRLKNKGHEFSGKLISLLNETYHRGHPIHNFLIL